jgi:hypothetical protein
MYALVSTDPALRVRLASDGALNERRTRADAREATPVIEFRMPAATDFRLSPG